MLRIHNRIYIRKFISTNPDAYPDPNPYFTKPKKIKKNLDLYYLVKTDLNVPTSEKYEKKRRKKRIFVGILKATENSRIRIRNQSRIQSTIRIRWIRIRIKTSRIRNIQ